MTAVVVAIAVVLADAAALARTAPAYLTPATAVEHVVWSRSAARVHGVDADLLLSIAWHESRYIASTVSPEPNGKQSCGVMTPVPMAACRPGTIAAGYDTGAAHLRGWLDACDHRLRCALLGYAGGYRLIGACRGSPRPRACGTPDVFTARAAWIKRERSQPWRSPTT